MPRQYRTELNENWSSVVTKVCASAIAAVHSRVCQSSRDLNLQTHRRCEIYDSRYWTRLGQWVVRPKLYLSIGGLSTMWHNVHEKVPRLLESSVRMGPTIDRSVGAAYFHAGRFVPYGETAVMDPFVVISMLIVLAFLLLIAVLTKAPFLRLGRSYSSFSSSISSSSTWTGSL